MANLKYIGKNILNHDLTLKKGNVSGSATSTGSFGSLVVADRVQGSLIVTTAASGVGTTDRTDGDDLVVENSDHGGISILTPDDKFSNLMFGSPSDNRGAVLDYSHGTKVLNIGSDVASGQVVIKTAASTEAVRIDASQNVGIGITTPANKLQVAGDISGSGFIAAGTNVASDGKLRFPRDSGLIYARNQAGDGDVRIIGVDGSNNIEIGIDGNAVELGGQITAATNIISTNGNIISGKANGLISGSSTSTGSFGKVEAGVFSGSFHGQIGARYLHEQSTASTTWTMIHNLGSKYPNVTVYDSNDEIIIPASITATTSNETTLTFSSPVAGVAQMGLGGGTTVSGRTFLFEQGTASTLWAVTHSLGEQFPAVTIYDADNRVLIPAEIQAIDLNHMEVTFQNATSGNGHFSVGNGLPGVNADNAGNFMRVSAGGTHIEYTNTNNNVTGSFLVTGSIEILGSGSVSGSSTSTGSFGIARARKFQVNYLSSGGTISSQKAPYSAYINDSTSHTTHTAADNAPFNGLNIENINTTNDAHASVGFRVASFDAGISAVYGGSTNVGKLAFTMGGNEPLVINSSNQISGSAVSTGSFGSVAAGGTGLNTFAGSVSIGNTGIHEKLRVEGEIKAHADVGDVRISIDSATNSDAQLKFLNGGGNSHVIFSDGSATNDPLIFYDYASSTQMMTLNNGKVGIGTTSPARALHVVGDALITGILTAQEFHTEFVSASVMFDSGSTKFGDTQDDLHHFTGSIAVTGSSLTVSNPAADIKVSGGDNVSMTIESTNAARNNSLHFKNTADNKHFEFKQNSFDPGSGTNQLELLSTDTADIMVVNQNGNIGIGTTNPDNTLHVHKGTAGSVAGNNSTTPLVVENNNHNFIQFLNPADKQAGLYFGSPSNNYYDGTIAYDKPNDQFSFEIDAASGNNKVLQVGTTYISSSADVTGSFGQLRSGPQIITNNVAGNTALTIDNNTEGYAILSNAKWGPNFTQDSADGRGLEVSRNNNDTESYPLVNFTSNHTATTQPTLKIQQDGAGYGIEIDQNGNANAIRIDGSSTTNVAGIQAHCDSLTTGRIAYFYSNSSDTSTRGLVKIVNDHASATGATALEIQQDSTGDGIHYTGGGYAISGSATSTGSFGTLQIGEGNHPYRSLVGHNQPLIQVETNRGFGAGISVIQSNNDAYGALITLGKSRGTPGTLTTVQDGDIIGRIAFSAADGTDMRTNTSEIRSVVNGTVVANSVPSDLVLMSGTSGSADATERMRLTSAGNVGIGTSSPDSQLDVRGSGTQEIEVLSTNGLGRLSVTGATQADLVFNDTGGGTNAKTIQHLIADDIYTIRQLTDAGGVGNTLLQLDPVNSKISGSATSTGSFGVLNATTRAGIGDSLANATATLVVHNASGAESAIKIEQDQGYYGLELDQDGNNAALYIDSEATTNSSIYIPQPANTAGSVLMVDGANSLTTGRIAYFGSNSSDTGTRNLVEIVNDHASATGATALKIQQDSTGLALDVTGDGRFTTNLTVDGNITGSSNLKIAGSISSSKIELFNTATSLDPFQYNLYSKGNIQLQRGATINFDNNDYRHGYIKLDGGSPFNLNIYGYYGVKIGSQSTDSIAIAQGGGSVVFNSQINMAAGKHISGSATSTGSFGSAHIVDKVGIGTSSPSSQLNVVRSGTVSDNDTVVLADISFTKTGGDADQSTLITGLKSSAIHNDANSGFGNLTGGEFNATNTQNKNAAGNGDNIMGISANTSHVAGIVNTVTGVNNYINVDAGGVDQYVAGSNITVDVESAVNITGDVYGQKIYMDVDDTNAAQVWGLEIEDGGSGNWDGGINTSLSDGYAISGSSTSTGSFGKVMVANKIDTPSICYIPHKHYEYSGAKGTTDGATTEILYVGHSHNYTVNLFCILNNSNQGMWHGQVQTVYGATTVTETLEKRNGSMSNITVSYNNSGGSQSYILQVKVDGVDATIYYHIQGLAIDQPYAI